MAARPEENDARYDTKTGRYGKQAACMALAASRALTCSYQAMFALRWFRDNRDHDKPRPRFAPLLTEAATRLAELGVDAGRTS